MMAFRKSEPGRTEELLELINLISDAPVLALLDEQAFEPMVSLLHSDQIHHRSDRDKELRIIMIEQFVTFGQKAVAPLLCYLMFYPEETGFYPGARKPHQRKRKENHLTYSRIVAAKNLGRIGGMEALSGLLQALTRDHPGIVLRSIGLAISKFTNEIAIQELTEILLSHQMPQNRQVAAITLADYPQSESITALILALQDDNVDVVISAVQSLGKIKAVSAIPFLLDITNDFRKHSGNSGAEILVSDASLNTIQSFDTETTYDIVYRSCLVHLTSENPDVRWSAVQRLGELGDERAIPYLEEALNDKLRKQRFTFETISAAAQRALQKIGTAEAISKLEAWKQNHP